MESRLLNIPFDVLKTVMECCVGVEYLNFRTTSKQCRLVAPMIHWSDIRELTDTPYLDSYCFSAPPTSSDCMVVGITTFPEWHLLLVIVGEFGEPVEVFKLNDSTEWEKTESLGRHVIYIGDKTCLCIEAKTPVMANKIYFPRVHSENRKIVFYSLETRRTTMLELNLKKLKDTGEIEGEEVKKDDGEYDDGNSGEDEDEDDDYEVKEEGETLRIIFWCMIVRVHTISR
ncbi:hypothetical protein L1987_84332 [Smallanthus sonchifolius]|uniref:Uncharacterized protein n=1 Tax=Smallanthus sonchifolius TaxID=185202 RepID=A0ACB8YEC2_9ASTR|nr:hypothetical protein L1987_84332 [Smallanthus sonchifolius]